MQILIPHFQVFFSRFSHNNILITIVIHANLGPPTPPLTMLFDEYGSQSYFTCIKQHCIWGWGGGLGGGRGVRRLLNVEQIYVVTLNKFIGKLISISKLHFIIFCYIYAM